MKRILFAIPIPYDPDKGFWTRDSGLVVLALRKMGYDAWLVGLGDPAAPTLGWPVIGATREDLDSPEWWQAQRPDAVVVSTWSAVRYDAIRRAALAATGLVVERLDTGGNRSARLFPKAFFAQAWGSYYDRFEGRWWLSWPMAVSRFMFHYFFPWRVDGRMVASMGRLPGLIAESPVAAERMGQMIERFSGKRGRIEMIPHPVNDEVLRYDGVKKENRVIAVGRWGSAQKDFPMLRRVLERFLTEHPDWEATVVGQNIPEGFPPRTEAGRRVRCFENLPHEELVKEYSRAKIYLMVSRYESFCIAAAEALCCGCSVVGSLDVPTSTYFAELESGTVAEVRTTKAFVKALDREMTAWEEGRRNPEAMAGLWLERVGMQTVARKTVAYLEELKRDGELLTHRPEPNSEARPRPLS